MLYLYIYFDNVCRQSETPPTDADIALVKSEVLQIYRWYGNAYEYLTFQQEKLSWETVPQAEICIDAIDEIGEYHA